MNQAKFSQIKLLIESSQKILLLLHREPDGDTINSALAFAKFLNSQGKVAVCASSEKIPQAFSFLPGTSQIINDFLLGDYDLIIAVDCGDINRTGFPDRLEKIAKTIPLINIDHHTKSNLHKFARINYIDEQASATAEIVYELLEFFNAEIDSTIATHILAGIYYDTGGFQHPNVTTKTLAICSKCLSAGARMGLITHHMNGTKSSASFKLWGIALKRMERKPNGLVVTYISQNDLKLTGASAEDASGIVNLINTIPQAKVAILFLEGENAKIRASLRTESDEIDVSDLARLFGGGGHKKAAGFTIDGKIIPQEKSFTII